MFHSNIDFLEDKLNPYILLIRIKGYFKIRKDWIQRFQSLFLASHVKLIVMPNKSYSIFLVNSRRVLKERKSIY